MKTIVGQIEEAFRAAIAAAFEGMDADPLVSPAQNEKFGDYQANAAMSLAKAIAEKTGVKTSPRAVAEQIKAKLDLQAIASEVNIAGPGFINVRLLPQWLINRLTGIFGDPRLGIEPTAQPQTVVVDYSGPNIAKQMHVGHLRSTIIGDAITRILEFHGDRVIRQNHIGDWGTQFGMLIEYLKEREFTGTGIEIDDLESFYREAKRRFDESNEFQSEARRRVVELQQGDPWSGAAWKQIVDETRRHYQPLYVTLGVRLKPSDERGESTYNALLPAVVSDLKQAGIATESEGAIAVFIDGPDKTPLIIQKSDGGYLYGTTDLAGIRYRINNLHATRIIYTHDSRQAQHFSQVFRTADKASWTRHGQVKLEFAHFGTMLGEDNKPFKTRTGETVKLKDLLDEAEQRALAIVEAKNPELPEEQKRSIAHAVGIGAVKYADLARDRTTDYVFSWESILSFDGNTAPYLQNAFVRIKGIFRKAQASGIEIKVDPAAIKLDSPQELALAKHVLRLGEVIEQVAKELKPHLLCSYLYNLASRFHAFFEHCPVLQSPEPIRAGRLAFCEITAKTIALGLDLLGIEHPDQM
jgi:arginyl-tRNA synthetase